MDNIPYSRQYLDKQDIEAVVRVLKSDWITQGPRVAEFEKTLAGYCGSKYAVATSSGTAALHIACLAAGLGCGDEAITTPITFLATVNSILYAGAKPVFSDIDYQTINIDDNQIKESLTRRTKAVLPVHFAGSPCDIKKISKIARKNGLAVIEDACHALGAEYKSGDNWIKVGSCRHSDMTIFSFHPVKAVTTGEGGAVTTNNKKICEKLRALRAHGVYRSASLSKKRGPWYYEMRELGFNYRMTDFQCALGSSQMRKLSNFIKRRRRIAGIYNKAFGKIPGIIIPHEKRDTRHAYHLYILQIDFGRFKISRKDFLAKLKKKGILNQVHYIPVYWQPYYQKLGYKKGLCPVAEDYYHAAVSIPIFQSMRGRDAEYAADSILGILKET